MVRLIGKGLGGRWWLATITLVVAAAVVLAVAAGRADSNDRDAADPETATASATPSSVPGSASAEAGALAPPTPPAKVCESATLRGPSKRPAEAVEVSTEQSLADVVRAGSARTTYW